MSGDRTTDLPLEIAARACARVETISYPNTDAGRQRAQAYVDANWMPIWETMQHAKR